MPLLSIIIPHLPSYIPTSNEVTLNPLDPLPTLQNEVYLVPLPLHQSTSASVPKALILEPAEFQT